MNQPAGHCPRSYPEGFRYGPLQPRTNGILWREMVSMETASGDEVRSVWCYKPNGALWDKAVVPKRHAE